MEESEDKKGKESGRRMSGPLFPTKEIKREYKRSRILG